jgi:hypothetical protein
MNEVQFALLLLCMFLYQDTNHPSTSRVGNILPLQPISVKEMNQQSLGDVESPLILIELASLKLHRRTPVVVKLRIENATRDDLHLSEPSNFFLQKPEGEELERMTQGYTASACLWVCLQKTSQPNASGILHPGEAVRCEIDLTELNWGLSKSAVYDWSPTYPAGNLFHEVSSGRYQLFFGLHSPQKVIGGLPRVHLFRSNVLSVTLKK